VCVVQNLKYKKGLNVFPTSIAVDRNNKQKSKAMEAYGMIACTRKEEFLARCFAYG
jgi:hypothetical protein